MQLSLCQQQQIELEKMKEFHILLVNSLNQLSECLIPRTHKKRYTKKEFISRIHTKHSHTKLNQLYETKTEEKKNMKRQKNEKQLTIIIFYYVSHLYFLVSIHSFGLIYINISLNGSIKQFSSALRCDSLMYL